MAARSQAHVLALILVFCALWYLLLLERCDNILGCIFVFHVSQGLHVQSADQCKRLCAPSHGFFAHMKSVICWTG